jgi:hypothetical protein
VKGKAVEESQNAREDVLLPAYLVTGTSEVNFSSADKPKIKFSMADQLRIDSQIGENRTA